MWLYLQIAIVLSHYNISAFPISRSHTRRVSLPKFRPATNAFGETPSKRDESKRGLDIGLRLNVPTEQNPLDLENMKDELVKALSEVKNEKELEKVLDMKEVQPTQRLLLKPAFECDSWDFKSRTCWLDRNTGDTVTFSLSTGMAGIKRGRPDVIWKKEFASRDTSILEEIVIDAKNPSRNLVIGRRGYELRISPITEMDIEDNRFSASFIGNGGTPFAKVNFKIRIMPEDLGFVYIGETIDLSIESYVTLPLESMAFHWYTEKDGESSTLPSNMKVSPTGATLRISELRQEQEGIVTCSVYTNMGVHATKKRFLMKDLTKNRDVLKSFSDHNISFQEDNHKKRNKTSKQREKRASNTPTDSTSFPAETSPQTETITAAEEKKVQKWERKGKSGLKREREAIRANLEGEEYTMLKPDRYSKQNYGADLSSMQNGNLEDQNLDELDVYGNSTSQDTIVNINLRNQENIEDDKISQLVSNCIRDIECSKHATCIRKTLREKGFCRCLPGYYGPGIFCREDM